MVNGAIFFFLLNSADSESRDFETCYEKMRRWRTVGSQLGCSATERRSAVTHRFLPSSIPASSSMKSRSGRERKRTWSYYYKNNNGVIFPCIDFHSLSLCFALFAWSVMCTVLQQLWGRKEILHFCFPCNSNTFSNKHPLLIFTGRKITILPTNDLYVKTTWRKLEFNIFLLTKK